MTTDLVRRQQRRRRAHAHRCPSCLSLWALRVTHHPSGVVVVCQVCGFVRLSVPASRLPGAQGDHSGGDLSGTSDLPGGAVSDDAADGVVVPLRGSLRSS